MIYVYARKGEQATTVAGVKVPVHSILCIAKSIPEAGTKLDKMFNYNSELIKKADVFMIDTTDPK